MTEAIYDVVDFLMLAVEGFLAQKLFRCFAAPKARFSFAKYAVGVYWTALNVACYYLLDNGSYEPILIVKLLVYTLGLTLFSVLWYRGSMLERIFPALVFSALRELTVQLTNCLTGVNGIVLDIMIKISEIEPPVMPYEIMPDVTRVIVALILAFIAVVREVIIWVLVKSVIKLYRYKPQTYKETLLYMLPCAVGLLVSAILRFIIIYFQNGYTMIIYERYPPLYFIIPAASALLLAAIMYTFRLCQDISSLRREQADRAVLESQLESIQSGFKEKERLYESVRAARHDMRNDLTVLRGLISRKCPDDEEINSFFESMDIISEQHDGEISTGDLVCDTIINGKLRYAKSELPDIIIDADGFAFSDSTGIKPYDMGVILSNGLDNAIEACKRLKEASPEARAFITLRSFTRKNMFFAEIENSFDGVLQFDAESGLPLTAKEDGRLHGIGMRNIKSCAEKYSGGMEFIVKDGAFTLSVMMKEQGR